MFGPDGTLHYYPRWFYLLLKGTHKRLVRAGRAGILERQRKAKHLSILPSALTVLRPLLDLPNHSPYRPVRAIDLSFSGGQARHSGRRGLVDLLECGIDARVVKRQMQKTAENLDHTRLPGPDILEIDEATRIVNEVKGRRKKKKRVM